MPSAVEDIPAATAAGNLPTAAEYEAFYFEILPKQIWWSSDETCKITNERWKTQEAYRGYLRWVMERSDRMMEEWAAPVSREDLLEMIEKTNYNNDLDRAKLTTTIGKMYVPWIPVGRDKNGDIYRIVPHPMTLLPDNLEPKVQNTPMSLNVLGVNTNVQPKTPRHRRHPSLLAESTTSNESDDDEDEGNGFIFHQLGVMEIWCNHTDSLTCDQDAAEGPWLPCGFCVVIRFGRNGVANGIYIIYDFYLEDYLTGNRYPKVEDDSNWGYLGKTDQQFSVAKIADKITDLGFNKSIRLTEVVDYPVEIVRTVKTGQGAIIRATVAQKGRSTDSTSSDGTSKDGASTDSTANEDTSNENAPDDGTSKDDISKDDVSKDAASKDSVSEDLVSEDYASNYGMSTSWQRRQSFLLTLFPRSRVHLHVNCLSESTLEAVA
jgi:hypothetical protein